MKKRPHAREARRRIGCPTGRPIGARRSRSRRAVLAASWAALVTLLLAGSAAAQDLTFSFPTTFSPLSQETVYRVGTDEVTGQVDFTVCQNFGSSITAVDAALDVIAIRRGVEVGALAIALETIRGSAIGSCPICSLGVCDASRISFRLDGPHAAETFEDWAVDFVAPEFDLFLRVTLDPEDRIAESDETNNAISNGSGFDLIPLNGSLLFGGISTSLGPVDAVTGGSCAADEVELTAGTTSWDPSANADWDPVDVSVEGVCALPQLAAGGYELIASNATAAGPVAGTPAGRDVELANVTLDATGAHPVGPLTIDLPSGHSAHLPDPNDAQGRPVARGSRVISLANVGPGTTNDLANLTASGGTDVWLRAHGLPLHFRMLNFVLNGSTLDGVFGSVRWAYDQAWGANDPRSLARLGPTTNDARFSQPSASQPNTVLTIAPTGLAAQVSFDAGQGETHFPRTRHQFSGFQASVVDGRLEDGSIVGFGESYAFRQSADCGGCDAGTSSVADRDFDLQVFDFQGIADDGAVMAPIFGIGSDPAWGPRVFDGAVTRNRFERVLDNGQPGVFYLPGFEARQTGGASQVPVHRYLLGMRQGTTGLAGLAPGVVYRLDSMDARHGNEFAAGLTVGPQTYRDASGLPVAGFGAELTGTGTEIALGAPGAIAVESAISSPGTKYVVRPGGVTGVFNSDPFDAPDPTVYGYVFDLRRFAFRTVSNVLDDFTWIDGRVDVPAPGEFGIEFASLGLGCDGTIGGGAVEREACDGLDDNGNGLVDENCNETLRAWRTDFDVLSMRFTPTNPGEAVCAAGNRELLVGSTVDVLALDETLGLTARWTPAGDPVNQRFSGRTSQVLDRPISPASGAEDIGFDVALDGGMEMRSLSDDAGWFETDASLALPFWEALDVRARLENATTSQQDQSIVVDASYALPNADNATAAGAMRNDPNSYPSAQYTWGSTGYGIGLGPHDILPLYYESSRFASQRPRFLGKDNELFDVVVADMRAGVNFADPERTKVSFGASADFTKLAALDIDLNVDLSSDESVTEIDGFLNSLGIPGMPTQDLVGEIRSKTNLVNDVIDAGLDGFIEDAVVAAIDPFDLEPLSDALGLAQSIPEQMASIVADELAGTVDALIEPLSDPLDQAALDLYQNLPDLFFDASLGSPDVPALEAAADGLSDADRALGEVERALDRVEASVAQAESTFDAAFDDTATWVGDAQSAISDLNVFLTTGSDLASCGSGNPLRTRVVEVQLRVDDFVAALDSVDLESFASLVDALIGVDLSAISSAQRDIRSLAEDLAVRIGNAQAELNVVLGSCTSVPYTNVLDDASGLLSTLNTQLGQITAAMATLRSELQTGTNLFGRVTDAVSAARQQIGEVRVLVADLRAAAEAAQGGDILDFSVHADANAIRDELDTRLLELSDGALQWYYPPGATPEHSFVSELASLLREPIDQAVADVAAEVQLQLGALSALVPGPSPEELRDLVVDLVMNSPVVEEIDRITQLLLSEIVADLNVGSLLVFDQLNAALKDLFERIEGAASEAILAAAAPIKDVPVFAGKLDGFAVIAGNELERLHVGADFKLVGGDDSSSSRFEAALDVTSWAANGKAEGCLVSADGRLDAVISTRNLPIEVGAADVLIKELYLGFTLDQLAPVGVFGGISTEGAISFEAFEIYDVAFHSGVGTGPPAEVYLGARAGAVFESVQLDVAFLVGKTCNLDVVRSLDPQIAEFIELPDGRFNGAFVRGSASIPIFSSGCFLTVGVGADAGAWLLVDSPLTIGGVVGGAAYGQALCIASLRGQVTVFGQKSGDQFSFEGTGFGVAGIGLDCDPATWTSVPRSRGDSWCGTGDAQFGVQFRDGWNVDPPSTSAIH